MAVLRDLLTGLQVEVVRGSLDTEVRAVEFDSRRCVSASLFACIYGYLQDGHDFIAQALSQGATVILCQKNIWEKKPDLSACAGEAVTIVLAENTRAALARVSAAFYGNPSSRLRLLGLTGTKGKTTSAYMTREIFVEAGHSTGLIGTNVNVVGNQVSTARRTTPESLDLQRLLANMVEKGDDTCIMEVSSQGLKLDRVTGCTFAGGAFLNLYNDHIGENEHADREEYFSWKLHLFDLCPQVVVNGDCDEREAVLARAEENGCEIITYGLRPENDVYATDLRTQKRDGFFGTSFLLHSPWYEGRVFVALPTEFNVCNALCAICFAGLAGLPFEAVCRALERISVPGRLQNIPHDGDFSVYVDYAHNEASLELLLQSLREYTSARIITVFGCGGNRSKDRRYDMGRVSGSFSDFTIITSDNPRSEEPMDIIQDILTGFIPTGGKYEIEANRRLAIARAIALAEPDDIVVIAGKGHEDYQEFKNETIHFSDVETAEEILKGRNT